MNDCEDGSDEPAQCVHNYSEYCDYGFWCTNDPTPCVPKHKVCDGVYDCDSSHDEASCGKLIFYFINGDISTLLHHSRWAAIEILLNGQMRTNKFKMQQL